MNEHGGGLRFTETNSGEDSRGSIWGLEGSSFFALIVGAAVSVGIMLLMFTSMRGTTGSTSGPSASNAPIGFVRWKRTTCCGWVSTKCRVSGKNTPRPSRASGRFPLG